MIPTLVRLFTGKHPAKQHPRKTPTLKDLVSIRLALLEVVQDCDGVTGERLRHKIQQARSAQELWLLRNDAYQLIAQRHNQSVAADRINALISAFDGWVEPKQLVRIR